MISKNPVQAAIGYAISYASIDVSHEMLLQEKELRIVIDEQKLVECIGRLIPQIKDIYFASTCHSHQLNEKRKIDETSIETIVIRIGDKTIRADESFEITHHRKSLGFKKKDK